MRYLSSVSLQRLGPVLFILLPLLFQVPEANSDEYFFPTIEFESAFTAVSEVPLEWIEIIITARDPNTMEFFEEAVETLLLPKEYNEATGRREAQNTLPLRLKVADFVLERMWILYRIDDRSAAITETFKDPYLEILYERYSDSAWLFELPLITGVDKIHMKGDQLTYRPTDSQEPMRVAGTTFRASYFRQRRGMKGGRDAYIRFDRLSGFREYAQDLNRDLPESLRLNPENEKVWQGSVSLHLPSGAAKLGPGEIDKSVVKQEYIPVFIVLKGSPEVIALSQQRPWFIAPEAKTSGGDSLLRDPSSKEKTIYIDLPREDPALWERLSSEAKKRYSIPDRITPGEEAKLIVFWKPTQRDKYFPAIFFIYIRSTSGEDFRTIVLEPALAVAE